jgi:MFS family permease
MTMQRLLPLSGVAFLALAILGFAIAGDTPRSDASAQKVAAFYAENSSNGIAASYVLAWAAPFLVLFGAVLGTAFWRSGNDGVPAFPIILLSGAAIAAAGFLAASAFHFAVSEGAKHHYSPQTLQALSALDQDAQVIFTGGLGVMLVGAAGVLTPRAGAYRWLGWASLILAIGIYLPYGIGFIAFALTGLWIATLSVVLAARRQPEPADAVL